jgi:hypothetical protein
LVDVTAVGRAASIVHDADARPRRRRWQGREALRGLVRVVAHVDALTDDAAVTDENPEPVGVGVGRAVRQVVGVPDHLDGRGLGGLRHLTLVARAPRGRGDIQRTYTDFLKATVRHAITTTRGGRVQR